MATGCMTMTKAQWVTTRAGRFTPDALRLADEVFHGADCLAQLHDALLEAGHEHLAEHFADPATRHKGRSPGPGQCWALLLIQGRLPRRRQLLGTPTASEWLGITPARFRRLAVELNLQPEDTYANEHYKKTGPLCPLWAPENDPGRPGRGDREAFPEANEGVSANQVLFAPSDHSQRPSPTIRPGIADKSWRAFH